MKRTYTITYQGHVHTCKASSIQSACRKAFKLWVSSGTIKRQPASDDAGGFKDVEVEIG